MLLTNFPRLYEMFDHPNIAPVFFINKAQNLLADVAEVIHKTYQIPRNRITADRLNDAEHWTFTCLPHDAPRFIFALSEEVMNMGLLMRGKNSSKYQARLIEAQAPLTAAAWQPALLLCHCRNVGAPLALHRAPFYAGQRGLFFRPLPKVLGEKSQQERTADGYVLTLLSDWLAERQ